MLETKKCPYCAEEVKAEAKKCRFCGEWFETSEAKLEEETSQLDTKDEEQKNAKKINVATKQCIGCKEEIKSEAENCPYCGEKDQGKGCLIVTGIIAGSFVGFVLLGPLFIPVFLAVVILIWWIYNKSNTKSEDETSQPVSSEKKQNNAGKEQSTQSIVNEKRSFLRRVPGFRSNTAWKKVVATIGYFFIFILIIGIFAGDPPGENDEAPVEEEVVKEELVPDEIRLTEDFENWAEETKAKNAEEWPEILEFIESWNYYVSNYAEQHENEIMSEKLKIDIEDVKMFENHDKAAQYRHEFSENHYLELSMQRDFEVFSPGVTSYTHEITDEQEALTVIFSWSMYLASYFDDLELEDTGAIIEEMGLTADLDYEEELIEYEYKDDVLIVFDSFRGETWFYVSD